MVIGIFPGKQVVFVTNNSTKSRADYKKKLDAMGIPAEVVSHTQQPQPPLPHSPFSPFVTSLPSIPTPDCRPLPPQEEVFGSAYSAAIYISRILSLPPSKRTVFILGESGIETELASESHPYIGGTDPALRRAMTPGDYTSIASGEALDPTVGVVLVGLDFHINYLKLALAYHYIRRGAIFLATNVDSTLPNSHTLFPGAGSISAPLVKMLGGREPEALGKPSQKMMEAIEGKFRFERGRTCMVGDRLDTDIRFGIEGKLGGTLAVLTGVARKEEWEGEDKEIVPAAYVDRLGDLMG